MNEDDVLHEPPVLWCKMPDFNMTRAISWSIVVDDLDHQIVVLTNGSRLSLSMSCFMKNELKAFGCFHCSISCNQFHFSGTL